MSKGRAKGHGALGPAIALGMAVAADASSALAENRAVVIGVDDYVGLGDGATLSGAVADARRFRDGLIQSWGFDAEQVTLLIDAAATSDAILAAVIDELIGLTGPGDRAVFYFAGMGTFVATDTAGAPAPAIVAHDPGSPLERIPEDLLADVFDLVPDREFTVVIDAGFTEIGPDRTGEARARAVPPAGSAAGRAAHAPFGQGPVARDVWNAAAPGQAAWEEGRAGIFTGGFIAGLSGLADADGDGEVTHQELLEFVTQRTEAWCRATPACATTGRGFHPVFADKPEPAGTPEPLPAPLGHPDEEFAALLAEAAAALAVTDAEGLRLSLEGPPKLRLRDTATLRIEADRPGWLFLLDLHSVTGVTLIAADLAIGGEDAEPLGLRFRAAEPLGPGAFLAILLDGAQPGAFPLEISSGEPEQALQTLFRHLAQIAESGVAWSAAVLPYEIVP